MADPKYFAWIDLETTGIDDRLDPILEIGLIITRTTPPFKTVVAYEAVVAPEGNWRDRMDDFVLDMHTGNNLLNDIESHGRLLADVEQEVISLLKEHGRPHNYMLAGSGVSHFDRRFIASQMPGLEKWLQYPNMDVGILRRALKFSGRRDLDAFGQTFAISTDKPHRGLDDVADHLNEWRVYAEIFAAIPQPENRKDRDGF